MKTWKQFNKKEKKYYWHARFRLYNTQHRLKEESKDKLLDLIADIRSQKKTERDNKKHNTSRPVETYIPTLSELLEESLPTIETEKQRQFTQRVFEDFLELLPPEIKITELRTFHFSVYAKKRKSDLGKQTGELLKPQTVNKEFYAISGVLTKAPQFYEELQNWTRPPIPFLKEEDSARELNLEIEQFHLLLETLRKERTGRQTVYTETHRRRLADELEFRLETGLRRKEVARLEFKQFNEKEGFLKNVRRWKTKTVTKFFPLTKRAIEIIEARRKVQAGSRYIFTSDGEPVESDYRTLKVVCKDLAIPYGRYNEDGFVPHDLRHVAGTEIVRLTDLETAREYLGHSNVKQTVDYLHTNEERLKEAVRRRDELREKKANTEKQLKSIYKKVKNGKISEESFIENMRKIFGF